MTGDRTPTVFIVDDDATVLNSLSLLMRTEGVPAETFPSADVFLQMFDRGRSGCVVADLRMPGMSGLELLRHLRTQGIGIPVILITGHGDVPLAVSAIKAGAADFFEKPFDDTLLMTRLRETLDEDSARRQQEAALADLSARLSTLTAREREVMDLIVEGQSSKAVAARLAISPRTVDVHRARILAKMGAYSVSHLVRLSLRLSAGS